MSSLLPYEYSQFYRGPLAPAFVEQQLLQQPRNKNREMISEDLDLDYENTRVEIGQNRRQSGVCDGLIIAR